MKFSWHYFGDHPRKLRSVLKSMGVTNSLMKVAIFHGGSLLIDGHSSWANDLVHSGEIVTIEVPDEQPNPNITAFNGSFKIAYEDDDFLVINKDAGVATVPAHHVPVQDSLVNRVKYYYQKHHYPNQVTHVATRLDKNTSGLVIFPKHRFAHAVLDRQLKHHQVKKDYVAIISGQLNVHHGYIWAPIERDPESFVRRRVDLNGKESITEYWVDAISNQSTLVHIRLHTGRTHQIRVHFSYLHHPLLGDDLYGGDTSKIHRQALHCEKISFFSPFKDKIITCSAPLPEDMNDLLSQYN